MAEIFCEQDEMAMKEEEMRVWKPFIQLFLHVIIFPWCKVDVLVVSAAFEDEAKKAEKLHENIKWKTLIF